MKRIINHGRRRLGISGRPAIILGPNESQEITEQQEQALRENRTNANWLQNGVIEIVDGDAPIEPKPMIKPERQKVVSATTRPGTPRDERQDEPLPEGLTGEDVEMHHLGGGWYQVYVNGFKATDRNVRKAEAEEITKDYQSEDD
jgi:hypothetical protein